MDIPSSLNKKLRELMRIFLVENGKLNLSALRSEEACWVGNIQDSLAALEVLKSYKPKASSYKLMDIGTGGGFPLLPLAIALPDAHCVGLDSIKKKIDAIGRIAEETKIPNVSMIAERAEVLGHHPKHREQYDIVTSRAVAPLNILLEYCSPFVKVGGLILLWKSLHIHEELAASAKAQSELKCVLDGKHEYTLPLDFGTRQILIFKKTSSLAKLYPRIVGEAKKNPIG